MKSAGFFSSGSSRDRATVFYKEKQNLLSMERYQTSFLIEHTGKEEHVKPGQRLPKLHSAEPQNTTVQRTWTSHASEHGRIGPIIQYVLTGGTYRLLQRSTKSDGKMTNVCVKI